MKHILFGRRQPRGERRQTALFFYYTTNFAICPRRRKERVSIQFAGRKSALFLLLDGEMWYNRGENAAPLGGGRPAPRPFPAAPARPPITPARRFL
ncbi:hypothetical protein HMPREF0262_01782 [Clostridium sp. ATCC 29733]|nr:hypothetical protein HMPREF0262_01782 [Clostridium sp. ATCC 29733]